MIDAGKLQKERKQIFSLTAKEDGKKAVVAGWVRGSGQGGSEESVRGRYHDHFAVVLAPVVV